MQLNGKLKEQLNLKVESVPYDIITYIDYFLSSISDVYDTGKVSKGLILNEIILKSYHNEKVEYGYQHIKYSMKEIYMICKSLDNFIYDFVYYNMYIDKEIINLQTYVMNIQTMNTQSNEYISEKFSMLDYEIIALKNLQYNFKNLKINREQAVSEYMSELLYGRMRNANESSNPNDILVYNNIIKLHNDFKNIGFIQKLIITIFCSNKYIDEKKYPNIPKWRNSIYLFLNNI